MRAREIHTGAGLRVIAVESLRYDAGRAGSLHGVSARLEPAALVVCEGSGRRVIGLASTEPSLEALERAVPELHALLAGR